MRSRYAILALCMIVWACTMKTACAQSKAAGTTAKPGETLLAPTFVFKDGTSYAAGKAWCAKLPDMRVVLITALHLFGPDGGAPQQIPAAKLSSVVDRVEVVGSRTKASSAKVLTRTGYVCPDGDVDFSGDMVAFQSPQMNVAAFPLAARPPKTGDVVWLYTKLVTPGSQAQMYPGRVVDCSSKTLRVLLSQRLPLQATSGSPVIDRAGQVVGMLSAGLDEPDPPVIFCNPSTAMLRRLQADLGR